MGLPSLDGTEDLPMYNPKLLQELNWDEAVVNFDPLISPNSPGENLVMRPLNSGDFDRGFMQLLSQLTTVGDVSKKHFMERFESMMKCKDSYYVTVIEDKLTGQLVGAASLAVEFKFIHNCALRGRLEDVVVNDTHRGKQLGKLLVETVSRLAKHVGCYKLSLDCRDSVINFYEQFGYVKEEGKGNFLTIRYSD